MLPACLYERDAQGATHIFQDSLTHEQIRALHIYPIPFRMLRKPSAGFLMRNQVDSTQDRHTRPFTLST